MGPGGSCGHCEKWPCSERPIVFTERLDIAERIPTKCLVWGAGRIDLPCTERWNSVGGGS